MLRGNCFSLLLLLFILFNLLYFGSGLKCTKGGTCESLATVDINAKYYLHEYGETECDECLQFRCIVNGKHVMIGAGCLEDYQKICNPTEDDMKMLNDKSNSMDHNDHLIFVKCTDKPHCADEFMNQFGTNNVDAALFGSKYNKSLGENCNYPGTINYQNRGFQIYGAFIFALILFYLW